MKYCRFLKFVLLFLFLPLLKRILPFPCLIGLMHPRENVDIAGVRFLQFLLRRKGNCLETSLLSAYLSASQRPELYLMVGFQKEGTLWKGHCWLTAAERPSNDTPEPVGSYVPVLVFRFTQNEWLLVPGLHSD